MTNPLNSLNEVFGAAFRGASKGETPERVLSKLLLVFAMLLGATDRESATSPFFPLGPSRIGAGNTATRFPTGTM
jgi:hypothetical protein